MIPKISGSVPRAASAPQRMRAPGTSRSAVRQRLGPVRVQSLASTSGPAPPTSPVFSFRTIPAAKSMASSFVLRPAPRMRGRSRRSSARPCGGYPASLRRLELRALDRRLRQQVDIVQTPLRRRPARRSSASSARRRCPEEIASCACFVANSSMGQPLHRSKHIGRQRDAHAASGPGSHGPAGPPTASRTSSALPM